MRAVAIPCLFTYEFSNDHELPPLLQGILKKYRKQRKEEDRLVKVRDHRGLIVTRSVRQTLI